MILKHTPAADPFDFFRAPFLTPVVMLLYSPMAGVGADSALNH